MKEVRKGVDGIKDSDSELGDSEELEEVSLIKAENGESGANSK